MKTQLLHFGTSMFWVLTFVFADASVGTPGTQFWMSVAMGASLGVALGLTKLFCNSKD